MSTPPDPIFVWGNRIEAGVWFVIAVALAWRYRRTRPRGPLIATTGLLLAFAASDLVEVSTGAWWKPSWLLGWKALCLVGLVIAVGVAWHRRRRSDAA